MTEERRLDSPEWWGSRTKANGISAEASDYSEWTHSRRLEFIADRVWGTVVDIPSGVGLLDVRHGPFDAYVAVDFAAESLDAYVENAVTPDHRTILHDLSDGLPDLLELDVGVRWRRPVGGLDDRYDWAVVCGLTPCGYLFEDESAMPNLVVGLLESCSNVLINFPWSGVKHTEWIRPWSIDGVMASLLDAGVQVQVEFGYLPHEFAVVATRKP